MKGVKVNIPFEEGSKRMEMLYRIGYCIILSIIASVLGILISVLMGVQFLLIVITAKKHEKINHYIQAFVLWSTEINAYLCMITDERPNLIPTF